MSNVNSGILGYTEINELIDAGLIEHCSRKSVNSNSLNVTLSDKFLLETAPDPGVVGLGFPTVEFSLRQSPLFLEVEGSVLLPPGGFALASLVEKITLPDDITAHVMLRSSAARMGIEHSYAGFGDSGYSGHLTLELKNFLRYHAIRLRGGDQICQIVFERGYRVPAERTYASTGAKYSGDVGPQPIKKEHTHG